MEQENPNSGYVQTISILDLVTLLLSKALWIILAGIIAAAGVGIYTKTMVDPTYESYITMSVFNRGTPSAGSSVSSSDLVASQYLADTYTVILQSDTVISAVIDHLHQNPAYADKKLTTGTLKSYLSIATVNETQVLKIKVTTNDPAFSAAIADAFANVSPSILEEKFPVGGVENLDSAKVKTTPVGPHTARNCFIGFFVGALLLSAFYIVRMMLDSTIHEAEDLENFTNLPLLGSLPTMVVTEEQETTPWKITPHQVLKLDNDTDSV